MKTILITGGTGLVGSHLIPKLLDKGYYVRVLTRSKRESNTPNLSYYKWDIKAGFIEPEALTQIDYIIHLAGAGIADKKWTTSRKRTLLNSRVDSLRLLYNTISKLVQKPTKLISANAIGYYGASTSDKIFTEQDNPNNSFISEICVKWENAASEFSNLGIGVFIARVAVVLTPQKGALEKMKKPTKLNVGSPLGNGRQYMPWIHIEDLCKIYIKAIEDDAFVGVFNAVADEHVTNKDFSKQLAKTMGTAFFMPNVPSFVLKLIFGEMADIFLKGSRISNKKLLSTGFQFKYPNLKEALGNLIKEKPTPQ